MWKNKNTRLSIILIVLTIITGIQLMRNTDKRSSGLDVDLFTVTDTLGIQSITLQTRNEDLRLTQSNSTWYVGEERADEYYISLLKAVLASVKVQRAVSGSELDEINERLERGARVEIAFDDNRKTQFTVGGNESQTRSYFRDEETGSSYVVNIPGYQSFVAGIFFLSRVEWKDKTLFRTPWTAIRNLQVSYPDHPEWDFSVVQGKSLLEVEGMDQMDTTELMDYANIFSDLKANYFFESEGLDTLNQTPVFMQIEILDIDESRNNKITIYELGESTTTQIGIDSKGQYFGFDYRNVNFLARKKEEFEFSGTP